MNPTVSEPEGATPTQKAFNTSDIVSNIAKYCFDRSLPSRNYDNSPIKGSLLALLALCRVNQVCFDVVSREIYHGVESNTQTELREQPLSGLLFPQSTNGIGDSLRQELRAKINHLNLELDQYREYPCAPSELTIDFPNLKVLELGQQAAHRPDVLSRFAFPKVDTLIMTLHSYKSDNIIDYIRRAIPSLQSNSSKMVLRWFREYPGDTDGPLVDLISNIQPAIYIVWTIYRAELYFLDMMYGIYGCLKCYGGTVHLYISQFISETIQSVLEDRVDSKQTFKSGDIDQIVARDLNPVMAKMVLLRLEDDMDYFGHDECERRVMFSKLRLIGDVDIDAEDWHKPFCRDWQYVLEEQRECYRKVERRGVFRQH